MSSQKLSLVSRFLEKYSDSLKNFVLPRKLIFLVTTPPVHHRRRKFLNNFQLFFIFKVFTVELQKPGHPDQVDQSQSRMETIDSNILFFSQWNVKYRTMKSQLVYLHRLERSFGCSAWTWMVNRSNVNERVTPNCVKRGNVRVARMSRPANKSA